MVPWPLGGASPRGGRLPLLLSALATVVGVAGSAGAESQTLAGTWNAGPLSESVVVHSWPDDCGPKPKAGSAASGGYTISVVGDELVFAGSPAFRSDQCWDNMSGKRVSHSATPSTRFWKTRCESPAGDPRKATITTVVRASDDDTIVMSETAKYELTVSSGLCSVTVDRSRLYKIISRAGAVASTSASVTATASTTATPTATATATPPPKLNCDVLGEARTLEVRPKKKLLRAGEHFDLVARLLDDKGCEVPPKPTFKLAPDSNAAVQVDTTGKVTAKTGAEPGKGFVVVEASGKSVRVEVEIVSDAKWAELLGSGSLDAGEDEPATVVVSGGGAVGSSTPPKVGGEPESRRQFAWLAVVGGGCTLLLLVALVLWRRGEPAQQKPPEPVALEPVAPRHGPHTPMPMAAPAVFARPPAPVVTPGTAVGYTDPRSKRCPLCGTGAAFEAEFCPNDGQRLVLAQGGAREAAPAAPVAKGRMCPVCGRRYEPEASFCNKDGVALVDVN